MATSDQGKPGGLPDFDFLLAVLKQAPLPPSIWKKGLNYSLGAHSAPIGQGSNNIPTCSAATALLVPDDPGAAVEYFTKRWKAELGIAPLPDCAFWSLGSQELGSSTYDGIEMASQMSALLGLVRAKAQDVADLGWRLLRRRAAFLLLGASSNDSQAVAALAGMRSTHRADNDRDGILRRFFGPAKAGNNVVLQVYDFVMNALAAEWPQGSAHPWPYYQGLVGMTRDQLVQELAGATAVVPWHLRMWDLPDGSTVKLTWVDHNVNGNTGCMYFWGWGPWQSAPNSTFKLDDYTWSPASPFQHCYGWPYFGDEQRIRHAQQGLGTGSCAPDPQTNRLVAFNLNADEAADGRAIVSRRIDIPPGSPSWSFDLAASSGQQAAPPPDQKTVPPPAPPVPPPAQPTVPPPTQPPAQPAVTEPPKAVQPPAQPATPPDKEPVGDDGLTLRERLQKLRKEGQEEG